jgi:hypothetical protein
MIKKIFFLISVIFLSGIIMSCSKTFSWSDAFQTNNTAAPFDLFHLFDGYPALKAAWDSVPGKTGNEKLADMLNEDIPTGAEFMKIVAHLLDSADYPGLDLLDDLKETIGLVNTTGVRLYGHSGQNAGNPIGSFFANDQPADMVENFYSMLDEITNDVGGTTPRVSASVMGMTVKILDYVLAKNEADIEKTMNDLIEDLTDPDFKEDFADLMDIAAPLVSMADYPMWYHEVPDKPGDDYLEKDYSKMNSSDSIDSGMGNTALGVNLLMKGMVDILNGETIDRASMYDLFDSLNRALADPEVVKRLIWNLANYGTTGGYFYKTQQTGNNDVDQYVYSTSSENLYSDVNLKATVKELLTGAGDLLLRDDRRSSLVYRPGMTSENYTLAYVLKNVKKAYINWDQAQIKESLYDLLRVDMFGRDRRTDPNAYSSNFLEHLLYLGDIGINYGYAHKANANEVKSNPTYDPYSTVLREHGHGRQIGAVTLNDVLFSIQSQKNPLAGVGNYELGFENVMVNGESVPVNKGRNRTYRSKNSFTIADRDKYKFAFSVNIPAAHFLSSPVIADFGVPKALNGGNVNGYGGDDVDEYMPYSPNGLGIKDMTSFTFSSMVRTCWEGEGPYYYKDPAAPIVTIGGFTGRKYLRPDGRIYALVNDQGQYFYPPDGGNDIDDNGDGQRENRYHATFDTDYYMIEQEHLQSGETRKYYVPIEKEGPRDYMGRSTIEASTADGPRCRHYEEIIAENYAGRGCASQEEAIFRNMQWLMNEKKIVFILPLWAAGEPQVLCGSDLLRAGIESAVFQVLEANGLSGFGAARKYRDNGVWAKANTSGSSDIPGDYRMIVMSTPIRYELYIAGLWTVDPIGITKATSAQVYDDILGKGAGLPGALAHNVYAITRFAFPRSPKITINSGNMNYEHYLIGSRNISNPNGTTDKGFSTNDDIWKKRNSLIPIFIALCAPLVDKSYYNGPTDYNNAPLKMLEGLGWVTKPLMYFNKDIGSTNGFPGVAKNSWQVRLKGYPKNEAVRYESEYLVPFARSLVSDWDIYKNQSEAIPEATKWMGSWRALNYYTPADLPTVLSILVDSDTSADRSNTNRRADGLLAKMVEYPEFPNRPAVTETPLNWTLSDKNDKAIDKICQGLEQLTTGMKGTKARGTEINEQMSDGTINTIKQLDPPEWRFQLRPRYGDNTKYVDMDLDDLLNRLVGEEADEGLNQYRDTNANYADGLDWTDITEPVAGKKYGDGIVDSLYMLTNEFLVKDVNGSNHCISEYLFDIFDVMAQHTLTEAQVKGLQYTLAKLLAYFDGSEWVLQGDDSFKNLYHLLAVAVPNIDKEMANYADQNGIIKGSAYKSLLKSTQIGSREDELVAWILATATSQPYLSRDVLTELEMWLESDLISAPNTAFYSTLAEMLMKMGGIIQYSPSTEMFYSIYDQYGFQAN